MTSKPIAITFVALMFAGLGGCAGGRDFAGEPRYNTEMSVASEPTVGPGPGVASGPRESAGTVVGAVGGAVVGSQIGGSTGTRVAAGVAGAAIGGMIGNRIGAAMDDEDRQRAYAAQVEALESPGAAPVSWRNPDSGRNGSIVPGATQQRGGMQCRQYTHTIYLDGQPQVARGTACRNSDGTWKSSG